MTTSQEILDALDGVSLVLDADLTVTALGRRNWERYWCLNGGAGRPQDPLGREVTSFFTEGEVRDTFRLLFHKVIFGDQGVVRLDYRCDARSVRRMMRLTLTPLGSEGTERRLLYQSILLSEAPRPPVPLIDDARIAREHAADATRLCPVCYRIWVPGPRDEELDWAMPPEGGRDAAVPEVVHEFCPRCALQLFDQRD
ncbi:MAG: hypothetical protein MUE98_08150 [Rhodobacteraceae bacterium]|jgi:hypothetical protein|nr:hypothetical protein [Paracoccaceae bacterium]